MFHYDPRYVFIVDADRRRRLQPPVDPTVRSGRRVRRRRKTD
jgi:hypothetical protein